MRITARPAGVELDAGSHKERARLVVVAVSALLALVFTLDAATGSAPFQHLYYAPIIVSALWLPRYAGPITALVAVVLYHVANPVLLTARYREADIVQIALFVAIGMVTAKLTDDRRRLRRLAVTDDLTQLYNLRGFEDRLTKSIRTARTAHTPLSLLVLDVDRLKSLNDTHGHVAGADAVRMVGHVIRTHLPEDAFACRFGGDEFVIALPGRDVEDAHRTAETFRKAVHAVAPRLAGTPFPANTLSISIGIACQRRFDDEESNGPSADWELGESLFRTADQALYAAKSAGRNQISGHEPGADNERGLSATLKRRLF